MTCVCGHERDLHDEPSPLVMTACRGDGRSGPQSYCGCAGYSEVPRCDFCMSVPAPWSYPARTTIAQHLGHTIGQYEDWAACEACAALIEEGDRRGVAERVMLNDRDEEMGLTPAQRERVIEGVQHMQSIQFWTARSGPRTPIHEPAPS